MAGCTELTGGEHFPALHPVSLLLEGNAAFRPGGRRSRGCRKGFSQLWFRAGSLHSACLGAQVLGQRKGRAGAACKEKALSALSACLFLLSLWGRLYVNGVVGFALVTELPIALN